MRSWIPTICLATLTGTTTAQLGPTNLRAEQLDGPSTLIPRRAVTYTTKIRNTGSGLIASQTDAGLYLSTNATITKYDRLLTSWKTPALPRGGSHSKTVRWTVPKNLPNANCYVGVFADPFERWAETDEQDNTMALEAKCLGKPDIVVKALTVPATLLRKHSPEIEYTMANEGGVTTGRFRVGFYLSRDDKFDRQDLRVGETSFARLGAGTSGTWRKTLTIPADYPIGACHLICYADDERNISEILTGNNIAARTTRVRHLGQIQPFGTACPGSNRRTPRHSAHVSGVSTPQPGAAVEYRLHDGPRNFLAIFAFGTSRTQWEAFRLPLAIGATGCTLYASFDLLLPAGTDGAGFARRGLAIPGRSSMIGTSYYTQVVCLDAPANAIGATLSNALTTEVGSPR